MKVLIIFCLFIISLNGIGQDNIKLKIHYKQKKQTATGLLNMRCHRDIPKQRSIDLAKACSRLFVVRQLADNTSLKFKHKDL